LGDALDKGLGVLALQAELVGKLLVLERAILLTQLTESLEGLAGLCGQILGLRLLLVRGQTSEGLALLAQLSKPVEGVSYLAGQVNLRLRRRGLYSLIELVQLFLILLVGLFASFLARDNHLFVALGIL
jgi:hypothetical protein